MDEFEVLPRTCQYHVINQAPAIRNDSKSFPDPDPLLLQMTKQRQCACVPSHPKSLVIATWTCLSLEPGFAAMKRLTFKDEFFKPYSRHCLPSAHNCEDHIHWNCLLFKWHWRGCACVKVLSFAKWSFFSVIVEPSFAATKTFEFLTCLNYHCVCISSFLFLFIHAAN